MTGEITALNDAGAPAGVPRRVADMADQIRDALHLPVTTELDNHVWRVAAANTRVAVTVDFTRTRGNRWTYDSSTLTVDGQPRPLAAGATHLAQIFAHPDGAPAPDLEPLSPADETTAPLDLQILHRSLHQRLRDTAMAVKLGRANGLWVLEITGERGLLRMTEPLPLGAVRMGLALVIDGVDHSYEAGDDLEKALRLLTGATAPSAQVSDAVPVVDSRPSVKSNAVSVRRATVIRN